MNKIGDYIPDDSPYEEFYNKAKERYVKNIKEIIGDDESYMDLFSWLNKDLTLHFVHRTYSVKAVVPIIFATPFLKNKIIKYNALELTKNILIRTEKGEKILSFLFEKHFFDFNPNIIIESSIYSPVIPIEPYYFADHFVRQEYKNASNELKIRPIELVEFNKRKIHKDIFEFEDMLKEINDEQFEAEMLECINAYNNQQFFVAAAGLGSILEHLLYLILEKHNMLNRNFPKNPTYKDYIKYLSNEPIKIDRRSKSYLDSLFTLRNSVSHFNKGFTSKSICQQMMEGIKNIFDNFYL